MQNEIIPFKDYFSDDRDAGVAAFSDYFRFNMLYKWELGSDFLAQEVKKYNLENYSWDYRKTCQIPWPKTKDFIKDNIIYDNKQPFLHLFSKMWRIYNLNKNHFYKKGIYEELLKKHDIQDLIKKLDYKFTFKDKYYFLFTI